MKRVVAMVMALVFGTMILWAMPAWANTYQHKGNSKGITAKTVKKNNWCCGADCG